MAGKAPESEALVELVLSLRRRIPLHARAYGIRWSALMALEELRRHGPLTQSELATRQAMAPATVSVLVRELRAEGLVDETPDPDDGRRRLLSLNAAGAARLERDRGHVATAAREWLGDMGAEERESLAAALPVLLRRLLY